MVAAPALAGASTEAPVDMTRLPFVPALPGPGIAGEGGLELLERGIFHHLHEPQHVGRSKPDWRLGPQTSDRLWTITLHYHYWVHDLALLVRRGGDIGARAASVLQHYWLDWIDRCDISRPGTYPLAWNAYAIATRLGWWIQACRALGKPFMDARPELWSALLASLWRQAEYLRRQLEWDLRGNHLLRDAVGLAWAGRFFRGQRPARWLAAATDLAVRQVDEQVLADGGHFERSPMYHLEVMHDLLALAVLLTQPKAVAKIKGVWPSMARYATWLCHPDGMTAQLNDGGRRAPEPLLALGRTIGMDASLGPRQGGHYFRASGVVVWHGSPWSVLFDVGEIGPSYQPGHAHADTLTLESSFAGQRLFVDPGSCGYDNDARRRYDRSTHAHNTVCIDRTNSSEVWHVFRVGRRAHPQRVCVAIGSDRLTAEAAHNGYSSLPGRPRHWRRVSVHNGGQLTVTDQITGSGCHHVEGGLLLAPEWSARPAAGGWQLACGAARVRIQVDGAPAVTLTQEPAVVHPAYGRQEPTTRLVWRYQGPLPLAVKTTADNHGRVPPPERDLNAASRSARARWAPTACSPFCHREA